MSVDTGPFTGRNLRLFRGSCGLKPRRRRQPGSGATCSEPVFPTKREGAARRCRRHAMAAEALAPPGAACVTTRATLAAQQCTQTPQSGAERPDPPICVHYCVLASVHNSATAQQCTQMPQNGTDRPFSAICVHYCVLASDHNSATAQQCTQMPQNGTERSF